MRPSTFPRTGADSPIWSSRLPTKLTSDRASTYFGESCSREWAAKAMTSASA